MGILVYQTLLAILVLGACAKRLPLPNYIPPCARTDPKLDECAKKNGQEALKTLIKGDPKYKIPVLDPMFITEMNIIRDAGTIAVTMRGENVTVLGFKDIELKSTKFDLDHNTIVLNMFSPRLELIGQYDIKGQILVLPITGNGYFNISLDKVDFTYTLKYKMIKKKDGLEYAVPTENTMIFTTKFAQFKLENLFNDKHLSDNMNVFLNENWEILSLELGAPIAQGIGDILQLILGEVLNIVAFQDIFPDQV